LPTLHTRLLCHVARNGASELNRMVASFADALGKHCDQKKYINATEKFR
jgi:hypothetical protein